MRFTAIPSHVERNEAEKEDAAVRYLKKEFRVACKQAYDFELCSASRLGIIAHLLQGLILG